MAAFAFAIRKPSEIDWMLKVDRFRNGYRSRRVRQHSVTDITVVANYLTGVANMLAIMTAKTT